MRDYCTLSGTKIECKTMRDGLCVEYKRIKGAKCITESPPHPKVERKSRSRVKPKKAPHTMTRKEWESAMDKPRPDTLQTKFTRASASEAVTRHKEIDRLNAGVSMWDDEDLVFRNDHRFIIAEALSKGRKVPEKVLNDYPDIRKWIRSDQYRQMKNETARVRAEMGTAKAAPVKISLTEKMVYDILATKKRTFPEIRRIFDLSQSQASKILTSLQLSELVSRSGAGYYSVRKGKELTIKPTSKKTKKLPKGEAIASLGPDEARMLHILREQGTMPFEKLRQKMELTVDEASSSLVILESAKLARLLSGNRVEAVVHALSGTLSGDLLTCSRWQVKTKNGRPYIRCAEFLTTCAPEDQRKAKPPMSREKAIERLFSDPDAKLDWDFMTMIKQHHPDISDNLSKLVNIEAIIVFEERRINKGQKKIPDIQARYRKAKKEGKNYLEYEYMERLRKLTSM